MCHHRRTVRKPPPLAVAPRHLIHGLTCVVISLSPDVGHPARHRQSIVHTDSVTAIFNQGPQQRNQRT
ncbi:hypothetical protein NHX12_007554 [Muraenolepis orangiensis]|uniref:Uncharacterized protein n=1 Tax=Muraenolepis orangiensis TaxID=630683 RepID=A0A9Q0DTN4_9TELE|nr:hypothetical protein NHX12_007554 [Muraenolepis orangiensis]